MCTGAASACAAVADAGVLPGAAMVTGVVTVLKPASVATSVYPPGWGAVTRKLPSAPELVVAAMAPLASSKSIFAPGMMAPVESDTSPCRTGLGCGAWLVVWHASATMGASRKKARKTERTMGILRQ